MQSTKHNIWHILAAVIQPWLPLFADGYLTLTHSSTENSLPRGNLSCPDPRIPRLGQFPCVVGSDSTLQLSLLHLITVLTLQLFDFMPFRSETVRLKKIGLLSGLGSPLCSQQ